jgi:transcriptional regulator with XRE-family HTH domain/KaiC/GvpD/RAD55 family RecA-like ATPase
MKGRRISSGVMALDRLLGGLRIGDNVVWHMDSGVFMETFSGGFLRSSRRQGHKVVLVTVNASPKTVWGRLRAVVNHPDVTLVDGFTWGKGGGASLFADCYRRLYQDYRCKVVPVKKPHLVEEFLEVLNRVEEEMPSGSRYLVDSLTGMVQLWGREEPVLEFFAKECPRLYELETVAYWILEREAHSPSFRAQVNHITQVALELGMRDGQPTLAVLKAQGRESSYTLRPRPLSLQGRRVQLLEEEESGDPQLLIGPRLRAFRLARGLSQVELAKAVGVSPSTISQVEGQQILLSIPAMVKAARALGVSLDQLVAPAPREPDSPVVTRNRFEKVCLGGPAGEGLSAYRITPWEAEGVLEAYEICIEPQARIQAHFFQEKREELGYLLEGELVVETGGKALHLGQGECIRLVRQTPHAWQNPAETQARLLWVIGG